jgi:hypothetical protein
LFYIKDGQVGGPWGAEASVWHGRRHAVAGSRQLGVWHDDPLDSGIHSRNIGPLGGGNPGDLPGPLGMSRQRANHVPLAGRKRRRTIPFPRLRKFLMETNWPKPSDHEVARQMETALGFFDEQFGNDWSTRTLDEDDRGYETHGFSPWAFLVGGKATKLTSAMQAIDFSREVKFITLSPGTPLRRYRRAGERGEFGTWYTQPNVRPEELALYPDQKVPLDFEVTKSVRVLESTCGDMLVDWQMTAPEHKQLHVGFNENDEGADYFYRKGGGVQYAIPNSSAVLRRVGKADA